MTGPDPRDAPGSAVDESVRVERVRMVFVQSRLAVLLSPIAAVALCWALWDTVPQYRLQLWASGLALAAVLRWILIAAFKRRARDAGDVLLWERAFVASVVLVAAWWGVGGLFLLVASATHQLTVFCFLMMMAAGSAVTYTAHPPTVTLTTLALAAPISVHFATQGSAVHRALALGALMYVAASLKSIRALGAFFSRTHRLARDLEQERNRAEKLARTDHLTGLNNRRAFCELCESAMRHADRYRHPAALMMLDVDHFKTINDQFGHAAGDEAIRAVATLIQEHQRSTDITCRFGGEEFAVLLPETTFEDAISTAERLRVLIEDHVLAPGGREIRFTASLGVARLDRGMSLDELIACADVALYEAKRAGRNRVSSATQKQREGVAERAEAV